MRATERLLEVIADAAQFIATNTYVAMTNDDQAAVDKAHAELDTAIAELRRRGDTLVRGDDLRKVLEFYWMNADEYGHEHEGSREAAERLENAIGGKP